jgi:Spy/CpxP family protein refolding chaperone
MTAKNKLFAVLSSLLMIFAVGSFAMGQDTAPATTKTDDSAKQEGPRGGKDGFGHRGGRRGFHGDKMDGEKGRGFGHRGGPMGGGPMEGGFHKLNLSDEQKQQLKTLHENFMNGNKAVHEEAFSLMKQKHDKTITAEGTARLQAIHQQMKTAHKGLRASAEGILTAEQKTQLETMKQERRQKMEERRKMREQRAPKTATPETKNN